MLLPQVAHACGISLLCLHCGGNDTTALLAPVVDLSLVTFKAAIGVGLAPHAEQRLTAIEQDLPALSADVVCLQELWQSADIRAHERGAGRRFRMRISLRARAWGELGRSARSGLQRPTTPTG